MTRKRLPLRYIVCLLLLAMLATGVSLSRYRTEVTLAGSVSVARPAASLSMGQATLNGADVDLATGLGALLPGDELVCPFEVRNYDDSGRTQVRMEYQVSAVFDPSPLALPLAYEIVPTGTGYDGDGNGWNDLGFTAQTAHGFELRIAWPNSEVGGEYMGKVQGVEIVLDARQVD